MEKKIEEWIGFLDLNSYRGVSRKLLIKIELEGIKRKKWKNK